MAGDVTQQPSRYQVRAPRTRNMPNLPGQLGLIDKLGGRICDLATDQLDHLVVAVQLREERRRRKAKAWRAYQLGRSNKNAPGGNP